MSGIILPDLELKQIERTLIAYTLCFDDVMKTLLEAEGIPYDRSFGLCREFEYERSGSKWSERIRFPLSGYGKYKQIGIHVERREADSVQTLLTEIKSSLTKGKILPIHFDGYYCPWDAQQKNVRRWHSRHLVLVTDLNEQKKRVYVSDPFYNQKKRALSFSEIAAASKFYVSIDTDGYTHESSEEIHLRAAEKLGEHDPVKGMESFLADYLVITKTGEGTDGIFGDDWVSVIEQGFVTRHYLRLFYQKLFQDTRKPLYGMLSLLIYRELQDWKECVVHSHKGRRKKDKSKYFSLFAESFAKLIAGEKRLNEVMRGECKTENFSLISVSRADGITEQIPMDITQYFNARACKRSRKEKSAADITGEGEYILPKRRYLKNVSFQNIRYPVFLGERPDHIRCAGQSIILPQGEYKGICFLVCSEWGRSQFLLCLKGKKEYYTDCILNDFGFSADNSVCAGKTYLTTEKRDLRIQKRVYMQSFFFEFPQRECITEFELPDCPSIHIFSAVLVK